MTSLTKPRRSTANAQNSSVAAVPALAGACVGAAAAPAGAVVGAAAAAVVGLAAGAAPAGAVVGAAPPPDGCAAGWPHAAKSDPLASQAPAATFRKLRRKTGWPRVGLCDCSPVSGTDMVSLPARVTWSGKRLACSTTPYACQIPGEASSRTGPWADCLGAIPSAAQRETNG